MDAGFALVRDMKTIPNHVIDAAFALVSVIDRTDYGSDRGGSKYYVAARIYSRRGRRGRRTRRGRRAGWSPDHLTSLIGDRERKQKTEHEDIS